eukprot:5753127-Prymnesium_polylepis.1
MVRVQEGPTVPPAGAATEARDAPPQSPLTRSAAKLAKTPPGVQSGSVEAERAKAKALLEYAEELEKKLEQPHDAKEAGLLIPTQPAVVQRAQRVKSRLSDKHGSMTMQDVKGDKNKRKAEVETKALEVQAKKQKAADEKVAAAAKKAADDAAFAACEVACVCGVIPCPWAKWKRCPKCGPKNGLCKARECVAARKPLLLGFNPAVEAQESA